MNNSVHTEETKNKFMNKSCYLTVTDKHKKV